uniref:Uncharacterized protein n=1 Tax=Fervidobacterium pennivorans TaxID=93466 RepID=A0A7C4VWW4_FERPE
MYGRRLYLIFGYVQPLRTELKIREWNEFRKFYCGVCTALKEKSFLSQFFLTYDSVFFSLLLTTLNGTVPVQKKRFCFLTMKSVRYYESDEITLSSLAFLLLLKYKLIDDYTDSKDILRKIFSGITAKVVNIKDKEFTQKFEEKVLKYLKMLSKKEQEKCSSIDETANIFGELVAIFFESVGNFDSDTSFVMKYLGEYLGKWIYVLDAYDDLEKDAKKVNYNPIIEEFKKEWEDSNKDTVIFKNRIKTSIEERLKDYIEEITKAYDLLIEILGSKTPHFNARIQSRFVN